MYWLSKFSWVLIALISACAPRAPQMAIEKPVCADCKSLAAYRKAFRLGNITYSSNIKERLQESEISYEEFRKALAKSLGLSDLLANEPKSDGYILDVQVLDVHRPKIGFTMTSFIVVHYKLYRVGDRRLFRDFVIRSDKTLRFSDSVVVLDRSRLSIEGAIRSNIRKFLIGLLAE